jgi:pimeloyl-ACP methyl ester carboxylesterase
MTDRGCFVLIPGAGGAAWYWHRVAAELSDRGHDVVAVDLPGEDDAADLADYVDAVVAAAGDRQDLVVVGQSLGGFTAVLACERLPVSLLVLVNAMIPKPGESPGEWFVNSGQREAKGAMDVRQGRLAEADFDVATYFLHDLPDDLLADAEAHAREQSGTPFATPIAIQQWPAVPTRVIVGRDDRFFPAAFQRRLAAIRIGRVPDEIPGGHLVALSHPIELADLLELYQGSAK